MVVKLILPHLQRLVHLFEYLQSYLLEQHLFNVNRWICSIAELNLATPQYICFLKIGQAIQRFKGLLFYTYVGSIVKI
jgi:hypothetical protein